MDVNQNQVLSTIDVAQRMIAENDYICPRLKLLEAYNQDPLSSRVHCMITACDVLCASQLGVSDNEPDWYWVLQLDAEATTSQIKSQHEKITALLEEVKYEFPAAVMALKLVHDAFLVLSNTPKRLVFDSKRPTSWDVLESNDSPVTATDNPSNHGDKSLIHDQETPVCETDVVKSKGLTEASSWPNEKSLTIIELDGSDDSLEDDEVECNDTSIYNPLQIIPAFPTMMSDDEFFNFDSIRKVEDFEIGQIWAAYDDEKLPRKYARVCSISKSPFRLSVAWLQPKPGSEDERKWCYVGLPVVCGLFKLNGTEETLFDQTIFSHVVSYTSNPTNEEFEIYPKETEVWAIYKDWKPYEWCQNPDSRKGYILQIVQILKVQREQEAIFVSELIEVDKHEHIYKRDDKAGGKTLSEIPMRYIFRFSHRLPSYQFSQEKMDGFTYGMLQLDPLAMSSSCSNSSSHINCSVPLQSLNSRGDSLKVAWSADDFASGQVWAIYDASDQMPRRFAIVNNLISSTAVDVTFLEPHPMHEEDILWAEENLLPGCGTFRIGAATATVQMDKFSHVVDSDHSAKKLFYRIYPRKGEIWAMYRNWNSKWKQQDFISCSFRIVEIISDFSEDTGVLTACLEEVPGYKTFFQRQNCDGFTLNRVVPRSEMLSFSHRVEAFAVPGIKAHGIPECSFHLEPDALPLVFAN